MAKTQKSLRLAKLKAELEQVDAAITKILHAQSYKTGSRSVQKVDLATLYKRKDSLEDDIAVLESGSGRFRRVVPVDR